MMTGAKKREKSAAGEIVVVGMGNHLQRELSTVEIIYSGKLSMYSGKYIYSGNGKLSTTVCSET